MNKSEFIPAPVKSYFQKNLPGSSSFRSVHIEQEGLIRTNSKAIKWMSFTAIQKASIKVPSFLWEAQIRIAPFIKITVTDSYEKGIGKSQVRLWSFSVLRNENRIEMNSGALHRYLAEAPWYPMALLPTSGVQWSPINDERALATLTHGGLTVSLEFIFNSDHEIIGIYTPGRWGTFKSGFKQFPWEGHFSDYFEVAGKIRVPAMGEVGWHDTGSWQPVWKGRVKGIRYW